MFYVLFLIFLVYKRLFVGEFMKFCFERFEVGIWLFVNELVILFFNFISIYFDLFFYGFDCRSNVDIIFNIVFEDLKNKLLFVWVRFFYFYIWIYFFLYMYIIFYIFC